MKKAQCNNCSRWVEGEDYEIMTQCLCGDMVNLPKIANLTNDLSNSDQVLIKTVFERGVSQGRPSMAQELIDEVQNERIKVNLQ